MKTKPVNLNIAGLTEEASKLVIAISNERRCTIDEAIVILANKAGKEAA